MKVHMPNGSKRDLKPSTRPFLRIGAAVAFLAVCAAGGIVLYQSAGETYAVIAVRDGINEGEVINRDDLVSQQVAGVDDAVRFADVEEMVGRYAVVDLLPGQVVTTDAVATDPVPGKGNVTVGLSLTDPQMPAGLQAGDTVTLVAVPARGSSPEAGAKSLDNPQVIVDGAKVHVVGDLSSESDGRKVTVIVPDGAGQRLAAYSAAGRVAAVESAPAPEGS